MSREGILIHEPYERINRRQVENIHEASLTILKNTGLLCYNRQAAEIFSGNGAEVTAVPGKSNCWTVRIPAGLVEKGLKTAPGKIILGARNPENALIMEGDKSRVYLVTGAETNIWLDTTFSTYVKKGDSRVETEVAEFNPRRGMVADLCNSAHVCEHLETLDAFIRNVNIQDLEITDDNKDVNKYFASLNNTTKHVMAGLTNLQQLDNVVAMAELIAGGKDKLKENPIISFITCLVKSPLQFVNDTTETFLELCRRGLPVVVSSAPQAGTSGPMKEAGIIAQINAEILAGIILGQLVNPGTPVLYGSVPARARLDTLGDTYGSVETSQYNIDCVQMARYYNIPNYSTSGVSDTRFPGQQATIERVFSNVAMILSGPQFLHCAFGLLESTSIYSLHQAVIDDAVFKHIKAFFRQPRLDEKDFEDVLQQISKVVATDQKMFIRYIRPLIRSGELSSPYPFEGDGSTDSTFKLSFERMQELMKKPVRHIDPETTEKIFEQIPGLLPGLNVYRQ